MDILLILTVGALNVVCFFIGAMVGQRASRDEVIKLPNINPITAIKERRERTEAEREQDRINAILRNVESYDGTGAHQEDIPRG